MSNKNINGQEESKTALREITNIIRGVKKSLTSVKADHLTEDLCNKSIQDLGLVHMKEHQELISENKHLKAQLSNAKEKIEILQRELLIYRKKETTKENSSDLKNSESHIRILYEKEICIKTLKKKVEALNLQNKALTERVDNKDSSRLSNKAPENNRNGELETSVDEPNLKTHEQQENKKSEKTKDEVKDSERENAKPEQKTKNEDKSEQKKQDNDPNNDHEREKKFSTPETKRKNNMDEVLSTINYKKTKTLFGKTTPLKQKKKEQQPMTPKFLPGGKFEFKSTSSVNRLNEAFLILSDKNESWQDRINSMIVIESIVRKKKRLSKDHLNLLKSVLIVQIYDLRSSIVKSVCRFVNFLGKTTPEQMMSISGPVLSALFGRVYNSVRAIRDPCKDCVKNLVKNIDDQKIVKELLRYTIDPHAEVRELAIEMIEYCVKTSLNTNNKKIEIFELSIENALLTLLKDANKDVRRVSRVCLETFIAKWPDRGNKIKEIAFPAKKLVKTKRKID